MEPGKGVGRSMKCMNGCTIEAWPGLEAAGLKDPRVRGGLWLTAAGLEAAGIRGDLWLIAR